MIAGKLRIERIIGKGGMGTVAIATHVGLEQKVAIKVLNAELANDPEVVARFVREARASAKLHSDHVCRVSDVGQLETGEPYIEMELLEGSDLSTIIATAHLPVETAVDYVLQACVAVAEAHQLGIIHRDLKPANLFVSRRLDGTALVKVLDFGIATAPSSSDFKITKTTTVMGSPGYMSPEHLRSARDVDARSDIWALGVILYEAVTGTLPFSATTITELAVKVVMDEPAPMENVDPRFAAVVAKCLQKPPEQRYQSVAELAADLAPLGGPTAHATATLVARLIPGATGSVIIPAASPSRSSPIAFGPTSFTSGTGPQPPAAVLPTPTTLHGATGQPTGPQQPPTPRRRGPMLVAGLGVVVVGGAAAAMIVMSGGSGKQESAHHDPPIAIAPVVSLDAAPVVAVADAPAVTGPNPAQRAEIRAKLADLAEQRDWSAILTLSDMDSGDPDVATVVADAKKNYTAQQLEMIGGYVTRGDCAHAKTIAGVSAKLAPDAAPTFDAKAATCTQHVRPTGPVSDLDAADEAYDKQDYAKALVFAEKALAKDPKNEEAIREAALSACSAGNAEKANEYVPHLSPRDRGVASVVCRKNEVALKPPAPPPKPFSPPKPPVKPIDLVKTLAQAKLSLQMADFKAAEALAQQVLAANPPAMEEREAAGVLGVAACRLKHVAVAQSALARLPQRGPNVSRIHTACHQSGTPIE